MDTAARTASKQLIYRIVKPWRVGRDRRIEAAHAELAQAKHDDPRMRRRALREIYKQHDVNPVDPVLRASR